MRARSTRSKTVIIAAIILVMAAGALVLRRGPAARPAAGSGVAQAGSGPRVKWPVGKRYTYAVSWQAKTGGEVAPGQDGKTSQALAMESDAEGEIALERASGAGSRARVALSWTRLDSFSFGMQGKQAQGDKAEVARALQGQTAFLEIDDRGRIGEIAFPPEMNPSVRAILRSLALELRYTLPEQEVSEWEAAERDSLGEVRNRYRGSRKELAREPLAYQRLDVVDGALTGEQKLRGGAVLALDQDGVLLSIDETIGASYRRSADAPPAVDASWKFSLTRKGEGPASAGLSAAAVRAKGQPLGAQVEDPDREKRRDERMAEGVSLDSVELAVERFENGTRPGFQFLARSAAYLRLHPEALPELTAKFKSKELTVKGRGLLLDLFAETGNGKAQQAMRDALASDAARTNPRDFSILIQRFTFVNAPERGSVEFLQREYDAAVHGANVMAAQGAVVALGSAVRRLDGQQEHALAREVNERLRAELHKAATPDLRAALVAALGNAGRDEDVPDLVAVAGDPDARIRDQVASALRTVDSKEARAGLLQLAADRSSAVAISAFGSLQKQSLDDSDWRTLAELAQGGKTPNAADPALVELVRQKGKSREEGRVILAKLLERNQGADSDLPEIIRHLQQEAQGK
jgi:hypothetical protein